MEKHCKGSKGVEMDKNNENGKNRDRNGQGYDLLLISISHQSHNAHWNQLWAIGNL